jgi:hypothetical protein
LKKTFLIGVLSIQAITLQTLSSEADLQNSPVAVVWDDAGSKTSIADNMSWSQGSKYEATKAITHLRFELNQQIKLLESSGAVTVTRKYVSTNPGKYPDWKKFVSVFEQFVLVGRNNQGKIVSQSKLLPTNNDFLESKLVQLNSSKCRISKGKSKATNLPVCSINPVSLDKFLKASLKTQMEVYPHFDRSEAENYRQMLNTCLGNKFKYSIKNGALTCPSNSKLWANNEDIPLTKTYSRFKYEIAINAKSQTATMTYLNRRIIDRAPEAKSTYGSVLMFSY